jgi:DNA-binding transcriptional regulator YiaG
MSPTQLRAIRERLGWPQARLADAIGVTRPCVTQWESGARPISEAMARLITLTIKETRS